MKSKLLIGLVFSWIGSFGQYVPDNETFSLQDVYNAVDYFSVNYANGDLTPDLADCFRLDGEITIGSQFDPTYDNNTYAPVGSLKRFRNYGYNYSGCTRPTGLTTATVWYGSPDYPVWTTRWEAYGEKYLYCPSYPENLYSKSCQYDTSDGLNIGTTVYDGTGTDCTKLVDGWYYFDDCNTDPTWTWYYHVVNGVITEIQQPS